MQERYWHTSSENEGIPYCETQGYESVKNVESNSIGGAVEIEQHKKIKDILPTTWQIEMLKKGGSLSATEKLAIGKGRRYALRDKKACNITRSIDGIIIY